MLTMVNTCKGCSETFYIDIVYDYMTRLVFRHLQFPSPEVGIIIWSKLAKLYQVLANIGTCILGILIIDRSCNKQKGCR